MENTDGEDVKNERFPASKKSKTADSTSAVDMSKLDTLFSSYGVHPLQDTSLDRQGEATPKTVLALL